jgi:general secretion pathway protein D
MCQSSRSNSNPLTTTDANIVNSVSYKTTGVQLDVKPRVTPGGMVQMDVEQQVSTATTTDTSDIQSPTFIVRQITSNVAVRSGQAVVLGGLIENNDAEFKGWRARFLEYSRSRRPLQR